MTITPMAPMPTLGTDPAAPAAAADGAGAETFGALIAAQLGRLAEPAAPGAGGTPRPTPRPRTEDEVTLPDAGRPRHDAVRPEPGGPRGARLSRPPPSRPARSPHPTPSPLVADAPTEGEAEVAAVDGRPTGDHGRPAEAARPHRGPARRRAAAQLHGHPGGGEATGASDAPVAAGGAGRGPHGPRRDGGRRSRGAHRRGPGRRAAGRPDAADGRHPGRSPRWSATAPVVTPDPAAAPAPANPVVDQVAPVFTRMVSGPEGQHRMMLRLHPADLGEVHLTVTVRGDTVDVTVAATPEARELLTEGSSELKSLLDSVGRTADRLVFRDLPGTGTTVQVISTGTGGANPDGQPAAQSQAGSGESGRSGQHGRDDLGRHHATGAPQDTEADRRTSTTTPEPHPRRRTRPRRTRREDVTA